MNRCRPFALRALLLLLVALGPLQAQIVFACTMAATAIVHDECCCEDHVASCSDPACDTALESVAPCCEQSVEIGVDGDRGPGAINVKPAEPHFDGDPPPALLSTLEGLLPPDSLPVSGALQRHPAAGEPGSDTWLVTRRLRI